MLCVVNLIIKIINNLDEAAEALGSIATEECFGVLKRFLNDKEVVVRDSCIVGLDMAAHEVSDAFQYAIVQ